LIGEKYMPIVKDRYRGTETYRKVYDELAAAASYRGTVTYQEIAHLMGLALSGSNMANQTGWILGEISEDEFTAGRPMLSAVAVSVEGVPGSGFYGLAKELGKLFPDTPEGHLQFWRAEQAATYKQWRKKLNAQCERG
jgi:hypothetical protein